MAIQVHGNKQLLRATDAVKILELRKGLDYCHHLLQEHFDLCAYDDVTCDGCGQEMQRRLLHKHTTSECRNRVLKCEYCGEEVALWATEVRLFNTDKIDCESSVKLKSFGAPLLID